MLTGTYVGVQTCARVQKYTIHTRTHSHCYMHPHRQTLYVWALATLVGRVPTEGLLGPGAIHAPLPQPSSRLGSPCPIGCCWDLKETRSGGVMGDASLAEGSCCLGQLWC